MENQAIQLSVSEFVALTNQVLEGAYPELAVEGEVASFKVNQGKYVFFDLKDEQSTVNCFMTVWQMRMPIEDGMRLVVRAVPKVTNWGRFSLTVQAYRPSGEGSLKKSFELLKAKLEKEGLFAPDRKRLLPDLPQKVAVISSTQAAGYADFIEIVSQRWGGVDIEVAHTQVQGEAAADQMIRAIHHFNQAEELADVLVLIRGGGSADDLASYNDEALVRAIAESRIPTLVGVGHETDVTLADMVADRRAATPSNAAQILVPDREAVIGSIWSNVRHAAVKVESGIDQSLAEIRNQLTDALEMSLDRLDDMFYEIERQHKVLQAYDPSQVLARGYAILRGQVALGQSVEVETAKQLITAEVKNVKSR